MDLRPIHATIWVYLKNCILWNLAFYNFCWKPDFQPLEEDWATSGLLNLLNGVNIANPLPVYAATRTTTFARDIGFKRRLVDFGSTRHTKCNQYSESLAHACHNYGIFKKFQNFAFSIFSKQLGSQSSQEVLRATWNLYKIAKIAKVLLKKIIHCYLEKIFCKILYFMNLARILVFSTYKRIEELLKVLKIPHGIILTTKFLKWNAATVIF